ncbi:MAG: sulfatase-like hydrolase/transferase, partial [Planctomycetales bacterium]|nr:sulfatase-like hydrolase/transferase [Planctomycetales bacterium]
NTLLIFASDNGGSDAENNDVRYPGGPYPNGPLCGDNAPLHGKKGDLYEGGVRVPTIVHWPARWASGIYPHPTMIVDWMPTLCRLAGYEGEGTRRWDGVDLVDALDSGEAPDRETPMYLKGLHGKSRAIRVGDWKLLEFDEAEGTRTELYDLSVDPCETRNQAAEEAARVVELKAALVEASKADGDAQLATEIRPAE